MAYVPVPKDLTKIKTKVMLNLTKRQLISFGSGALLGVPLFFLAKPHMSVSTAALLMVLSMLPFFLLAMYERNGQPLEKIIYQLIQSRFIRPKKRPYQTDNFYAAVERMEKPDDKKCKDADRQSGQTIFRKKGDDSLHFTQTLIPAAQQSGPVPH